MDTYVGPKEAMRILSVTRITLNNWEKSGKLEAIRTSGGKRLFNIGKLLKPKKRKICYC